MHALRVTARGKTQTLAQWGKETGLPVSRIRQRLRLLNWTPEQALGFVPGPKAQAAPNASEARAEAARRRAARRHTVDGVTGNLSELCRQLGLSHGSMHYHIKAGRPAQAAADYLRAKSLRAVLPV